MRLLPQRRPLALVEPTYAVCLNTMLVAISAALVVGVVGCATASQQSWTKAGAGPEELAKSRYECIQESRVPYGTSYGALSAASGSVGAGWGSRASVAEGGTDGGLVLLGAERHAQSEANRMFDACMQAHGWH